MTFTVSSGRRCALVALCGLSALFAIVPPAVADAKNPLIKNAQVTVWDVAAGGPAPIIAADRDVVTIVIRGQEADARFTARGTPRPSIPAGARAIVIELQDGIPPPLPNTTGYPLAFPRAGSVQVLDNARVSIWKYAWTPGQPTAMHFHDKDVVVTYLADGALTSTDVKGQRVVNEHHFAFAKFSPRDRTHTETLTKGQARAMMVELK